MALVPPYTHAVSQYMSLRSNTHDDHEQEQDHRHHHNHEITIVILMIILMIMIEMPSPATGPSAAPPSSSGESGPSSLSPGNHR